VHRRAVFVVLLLVAAGCGPGSPLGPEIECEEPDPAQCAEMIQAAREHAARDCRNGQFAKITASRFGYSIDCGDGTGISVTQ
jgi:hypothetical protein